MSDQVHYVTPEEMEQKRLTMVQSCQRVASVLMDCAAQFQEYASLVPHPSGGAHTSLVDYPTTSLASLAATAVSNGTVPGTKEKKPRKKREKKDPDAPKRPPSAYLLFQNEHMQQLRDEHKDLPYRDVLKLVAEKWRELSDADKQIYVDAYSNANDTFKGVDAEYKRNKEGAAAIAAAANHPIVADVEEEDSTSSDSESEDDLASSDESDSPVTLPPAPIVTPAKPPKARKTVATPAAVATPISVPATVEGSSKKDKKRKNKDIDPAILASTPLTEEKKKKKKTKE